MPAPPHRKIMRVSEELILGAPSSRQSEQKRSSETIPSQSPSYVPSPDAPPSFTQFHSTLERLLRTATAQLSDIAVLYAMSAKVSSQPYQDPGGIFSPAAMQPPTTEDVPLVITKDPPAETPPESSSKRRRTPSIYASPLMAAAYEASLDPSDGLGHHLMEHKKKRRRRDEANARQDPAYLDCKICPDCGKRANGSRSQSGLIYYYCRNLMCPGRGGSANKFVGWSKTS